MNVREVEKKRNVRLTTRGRKSGQPRTVTVWFVVAGPSSIYVQHTSSTPAQWYKNLLCDPAVTVDFGNGPATGRAVPITSQERIQEILLLVRRKYMLAWIIQLLGGRSRAVAAEITLT